MDMSGSRFAVALGVVALGLALSGCKILPIAGEASVQSNRFDPDAYATGLWADQVIPFFQAEAKPASAVIPAIEADFDRAGETYGYRPGEGSPWAYVVSGNGIVKSISRESRAGTLEVVLDNTEPPVVVTLQIGPVIRGNAIRDTLPFVSFKDFTNQLEYAEAGKALTALAVEGFAADLEGLAPGDRITFQGALSLAKSTDRVQITPVTIDEIAP